MRMSPGGEVRANYRQQHAGVNPHQQEDRPSSHHSKPSQNFLSQDTSHWLPLLWHLLRSCQHQHSFHTNTGPNHSSLPNHNKPMSPTAYSKHPVADTLLTDLPSQDVHRVVAMAQESWGEGGEEYQHQAYEACKVAILQLHQGLLCCPAVMDLSGGAEGDHQLQLHQCLLHHQLGHLHLQVPQGRLCAGEPQEGVQDGAGDGQEGGQRHHLTPLRRCSGSAPTLSASTLTGQ